MTTSGTKGGVVIAAKAGRQEITLANERLIGSSNWGAGRAFDGLRITGSGKKRGKADSWSAQAFAAVLGEHGTNVPASADNTLLGAYFSRAAGPATIQLTALRESMSPARSYMATKRTTLHGRALAGAFEAEGALQGGEVVAGDVKQPIRAWMAGARAGAHGVSAGVDALSGDAKGGNYTAFNTLYGTNHPFYGLMDVMSDATTKERGLLDTFLAATWTARSVKPRMELHHYSAMTRGHEDLGWEGDAVGEARISKDASLGLGYGAFVTSGRTRQQVYAQLRAWF